MHDYKQDDFIRADKELNALIHDFFSNSTKEEDENKQIIYHYTTWEGLKGIIENQCLWFTDYRFLNDISEINYAVGYFGENIFSNDKNEMDMFYGAQQNALNHRPFYVASMCARKDYLPAWRLYANDGAGFAVGFNRKKIKDDWYAPKGNEPSFEGIFYDVQYIDRKRVSDRDKQKIKLLQEYYTKIKGNQNQPELFRLAIRSLFPLVKHQCYEEEEEVRMSFSNLCYQGSGVRQQVYFKNSGTYPFCDSIPYISKPFEIDWINEIWTGPRVHEEHAENEIKKILEKKTSKLEHKIQIYHSKLPYKNLNKFY